MNTGFLKFPSIGNIRDIRKYATRFRGDLGSISFMPKIKLHGTNAGVRISYDGTVTPQKRNSDVTNNHFEFEIWVKSNEEFFKRFQIYATETADFYVYGEWAGPGIQKSDAISSIEEKSFFVFACRGMMAGETDSIIVPNAQPTQVNTFQWVIEPSFIATMLTLYTDGFLPKRMHILPWHGTHGVSVDWKNSEEAVQVETQIQKVIDTLEESDPYVKKVFGVDGNAEGLVFYGLQVSPAGTLTLLDQNSKFLFKCKTKKHAEVNNAKLPKAYEPPNEATMNFVEAYALPARFEKGMHEVCGGTDNFEMKMMGQFIGWVCNDIKTEGASDMMETKVDWTKAHKGIASRAAMWAKEL